MEVWCVTHTISAKDGQGRVNLEILRELRRRGDCAVTVADAVEAEARAYGRWVRADKGRLPTALAKGFCFAQQSTAALRRAPTQAVIHACGFVTWVPADVNTAHFVHAAWLRSPYHTWHHRRDAYGLYQWAYTATNTRLERAAYHASRVVVAVSEKVRGELLTHVGMAPERVRVIPNGVDVEEFHPGQGDREAYGLPRDRFLLLFAGELRTPRKNLDAVLRAMTVLKADAVHLAVAGDTAGSPYPEMTRRLGLGGRVSFLGFRRDLPALLHCGDAFVFPSHYEACTLVILEAMASGLPVLTAQSTGGSDGIRPGVTGFVLSDENNHQELAQQIEWLAGHPEERAAMGAQARIAAERYTWRHMAQHYIDLYAEVAAEKRRQLGQAASRD